MSGDDGWYYESQGQRMGPVSQQTINQKRREGVLSDATLIWHPQFGTEWRPLQPVNGAGAKPDKGMPGGWLWRTVADYVAWAIALWPMVLAAAMEGLSYRLGLNDVRIGWIALTLVVFGCGLVAEVDRWLLRKAGYKRTPTEVWAAILLPVYFVRRHALVGNGRGLFWIGTVGYVLIAVAVGNVLIVPLITATR